MSIFQASFEPSDEIAIAYQIVSDGREKIKKRSFIFKNVTDIDKAKQIVLNLYDDRGMDVVSTSKISLQDLYKSHNHMILEYDREKVDSVFS